MVGNTYHTLYPIKTRYKMKIPNTRVETTITVTKPIRITSDGKLLKPKVIGDSIFYNLPLVGTKVGVVVSLPVILYISANISNPSLNDWRMCVVYPKDGNNNNLSIKNLARVPDTKKKCSKCNEIKDKECYYDHVLSPDGKTARCKECCKSDARHCEQENGQDRYREVKGVIRTMYKTQKANQRNRKHGDLPYSKAELKDWLYKNNFEELYNSWVKSDYDTKLKPSVDRIDTFKGYSFNNMELITWEENRRRQAEDIKNGVGTSGVKCKALLQLTKDNVLVKRHVSYNNAARVMGYSLEYAIRNSKLCRNGFYWKYE